jgi:hypothetical protein
MSAQKDVQGRGAQISCNRKLIIKWFWALERFPVVWSRA